MCRIYDIIHVLCSKQIYPIYVMNFVDFHISSRIFIDVHKFHLSFYRFPKIFIDLHGFSSISAGFFRFSLIYIDLNRFS